MQILPSLYFETHLIKFYGKEKHNAKILSMYLSKFNEKAQNYSSIKVHVKWSLGEFERSLVSSSEAILTYSLLNGFLYRNKHSENNRGIV